MKFTRDIFSRFSEMKLLTLMVSLFMMAQASDELREFHKSGEDSRNLRSLEPSSKVFRQAEETFPSVPAADQRRQADEKKRANYLPDYDVFPTPFIPDFLPHSKAVRQAEETAAEKTKAEDPNKLGEKSRNLRSLGLPESQVKWERREKRAKKTNAETLKDLSAEKREMRENPDIPGVSCDCSFAYFHAGCVITPEKAPPRGYACRCVYRSSPIYSFGSCWGQPVYCWHCEENCYTYACCTWGDGNCDGYYGPGKGPKM